MIGAGGTGAFDGVNQSSGQDSIVVRNGAIRNWARHGVNLTDSFPENNRVVGILASGNQGTGIFVRNGCLVTNCQTYFNLGDGISAGSGSIVSNCTAGSNQGRGIVVTQFATVADCTASGNNLDGIQGDSTNVIRGNTCKAGGSAAGIRVTGNGNRIEGNHCASGGLGISVGSFGDLVIKNTCTGNTTNWSVAAGNALAPIIAATTNNTTVTGNTYSGSLGSTDPNANFTH